MCDRQALHHLPQDRLHLLPEPTRRAIDTLLDALAQLLRGMAHMLVRPRPLALHALAVPPLCGRGAQRGVALHRGVHEARSGEALFCVREPGVGCTYEGNGALWRWRAWKEVDEQWEAEEEEVADRPAGVVPLQTMRSRILWCV